MSCNVEDISSGESDRGSSTGKRAVKSEANSGLTMRGMLLSHDRYNVDGHLRDDRTRCRVANGYNDAIAWETGALGSEVLRELRVAIRAGNLLVLHDRLSANQQ